MSINSTVFQQLHHFLPRYDFQKFVNEHKGDHYVKNFTCFNQLTVMLYAQSTGKTSLRDISTGLNIHGNCFYHLGLKEVNKSTLSHANSNRHWQIYEKLFYKMFENCRDIVPQKKFRFKNPLYSLDSTTIDLCLSLFPWAKFRQTKGAIKIHTLLNNKSQIPAFAVITDGKQHDVKVAKNTELPLSPDSIIAFDRAYIDWEWLYLLHLDGMTWVSRAKKNMNYEVIGQHEAKNKYCLKDEIIVLNGFYSSRKFPEEFRRIEWIDRETGEILVFMTNNRKFSASTIAGIYKSRWQIELFFKWIKQNLRIKTFLGTSENAVKSQIWIAMIYYFLLCYIKYQTKYSYSLLEFTRIISEALFIRRNIIDLLSCHSRNLSKIRDPVPQLTLF